MSARCEAKLPNWKKRNPVVEQSCKRHWTVFLQGLQSEICFIVDAIEIGWVGWGFGAGH